jgi:hypothetical protein
MVIMYDRRFIPSDKLRKMAKQKYDWKKTAKKVGRITAEILLAGTLTYITGRQEFIVIVPLIEGALNYIKNKDK